MPVGLHCLPNIAERRLAYTCPPDCKMNASVAQLAEQLISNQQAMGSKPIGRSNEEERKETTYLGECRWNYIPNVERRVRFPLMRTHLRIIAYWLERARFITLCRQDLLKG